MIYYCVKTDEYLRDILDRVVLGAQYYCVIDVPLDKAESVIQKFSSRYELDQTARQRTYKLHKKAQVVVDMIVLLNQSLAKISKVRLCLLCTLPPSLRDISLKMDEYLIEQYDLSRAEIEQFKKLDSDRKHRLTYKSINQNPGSKKFSDIEVYELVQLSYSAEERKQKMVGDGKIQGWTWRLHKNFIALKQEALTDKFKRLQRSNSSVELQDQTISNELDKMWKLAAFRGVRQDIFKFNKLVMPLYPRYFNRKYTIDLKVPAYKIKAKRLVGSFSEMVQFQVKNSLKEES